MKKLLIGMILLLALGNHLRAQNKIELSGNILDQDGNPVFGATIFSKNQSNNGAVSGEGGTFSLQLRPGKHKIVVSYIGYEPLETDIELTKSQYFEFTIREQVNEIDKVIVSSTSAVDRLSGVQIGVEKIEIAEMARMPTLFGERDIMRSIQLLPGIKSEGEGTGGYQVRGGTSSQNLVLLDDASVINAGHLMGIFSTFNDDVLTNASLYKGQIPAQFGGATSSVFDIHTKAGDMHKYRVNGSIGLLSAKLNVEGPIAKDKASFFVAARRTYLDLFLKMTEDYKDTKLNFYDLNAKVNYNLNRNNKLFVSFFTGKDNMAVEDLVDMQWGNTISTLRWFHQFGEKFYSNTSLIYSGYVADYGMDALDTKQSFDSYIRQAGLKQAFTWALHARHEVKFGFQSKYIWQKSAEWEISGYHQKEQRNAWDNTLWVNEEWKATDFLGVSAGLRFNWFSSLGGSPYYKLDDNGDILETMNPGSSEIVKTHFVLEPRLSLNFRINEQQSIKAGYSRTSQNFHALMNGSMSMPLDRYTMSSNLVKPQKADQVSLGYLALTRDQQYEISIEGYYKSIKDILDYKDGKAFYSEIEIERLVLAGKGRAYGLEFYVRKNTGRFTGWIAYTLSWSENKIPGINGGKWYTASNDRRHDISVVGMYELPRNWHMAVTWVYNSGQALTAPSAKYELNGQTTYYYAERNGYRAPDNHRLDVSFTHTKKKARYTREWSFGIYNLYNRYNPFMISFENDEHKASGTKTVQHTLFGIVPSVSYNFRF